MSDGPQFDPIRILETLIEHNVRFVLVGGQAAAFHGASRRTADADIVIDQAEDNLECVAAALNELNWRYRVEAMTDEEVLALGMVKMTPSMLRGHPIQTLMTDSGALDVLCAIPTSEGESPGRNYSALSVDAIDYTPILGLTLKLAALDHIIESKQWADRPKDHAAIGELLALRDEAGTDRD